MDKTENASGVEIKSTPLLDIRQAVKAELDARDERKMRAECERLYFRGCATSAHLGLPPPIRPPWMTNTGIRAASWPQGGRMFKWLKRWRGHKVRSTSSLAHADECFRDIRERLEHTGTNEMMRQQIHTICNRWWASRRAKDRVERLPTREGGSK